MSEKKVFFMLPNGNNEIQSPIGLYGSSDNNVTISLELGDISSRHIIGFKYNPEIYTDDPYNVNDISNLILALDNSIIGQVSIEGKTYWPVEIAYGNEKERIDKRYKEGNTTFINKDELVAAAVAGTLTRITYNDQYLGYFYANKDNAGVYTVYENGLITELDFGDPVECEDGIYVETSEDVMLLARMVKQVTMDKEEYLGYVYLSELTKEDPYAYKGTWYVESETAILEPLEEGGEEKLLTKDTKVVSEDGVWKEESNTLYLKVTIEDATARATKIGWIDLHDLTRTAPEKPMKSPIIESGGNETMSKDGRITWDNIGEKTYETGCDHGVLFVQKKGVYQAGIAWNGLTSVAQNPSGAEDNAQYADNIKYLSLKSAEELGITINCFTTPDEFDECDGSAEIATGVSVGQQSRSTFGFAYRTKKGNDTELDSFGYIIHLVYGCSASPSEKTHNTTNESPEAIEFSYEVSTTPVPVNGRNADGNPYNPTSIVEIDSTKVNPVKLAAFEDIIYGKDKVEAGEGINEQPAVAARLPLPTEIMEFFAA